MTPARPPSTTTPRNSADRCAAIEHDADRLGIRPLQIPPDLTGDPRLERVLDLVMDRLGLGVRVAGTSLSDRARLTTTLFDIALGSVDARWPQRIVSAACDLADAQGVDDIDELRAFVAAFVQRALASHPIRRSRHFRSAVEWADEVGYLYGSAAAERIAVQAYRDALPDDPARALERLERAIFHRSARSLPRDTTLPEWRLAAAELCGRLGHHDAAVEHFSQAWPALDAAGDPTSERIISAFRSASKSARSGGDLETSTRFALEAVRRSHVAVERAVDRGEGAVCPLVLGAAEVELELAAALATVGNLGGALRWALYVTAADPAIVPIGSPVWIRARCDAALHHRTLGQPQAAADILTSAIRELRPLFGVDHPSVLALEDQLRDL